MGQNWSIVTGDPNCYFKVTTAKKNCCHSHEEMLVDFSASKWQNVQMEPFTVLLSDKNMPWAGFVTCGKASSEV